MPATIKPANLKTPRQSPLILIDASLSSRSSRYTEAAIAAALASGRSIDEFAASQRISLNTARTHLKSIFAKTGTRRQAQLVALLCQTVAMLTM